MKTNPNIKKSEEIVKHVIWMEKKGLVESGVKNSKITIMLTDKGRLFASTIL